MVNALCAVTCLAALAIFRRQRIILDSLTHDLAALMHGVGIVWNQRQEAGVRLGHILARAPILHRIVG